MIRYGKVKNTAHSLFNLILSRSWGLYFLGACLFLLPLGLVGKLAGVREDWFPPGTSSWNSSVTSVNTELIRCCFRLTSSSFFFLNFATQFSILIRKPDTNYRDMFSIKLPTKQMHFEYWNKKQACIENTHLTWK